MNKFVTLFLLMLMFLLEELYYWLPVTTTAKLANKAKFGNYHISNEVRDYYITLHPTTLPKRIWSDRRTPTVNDP